MKSFVRKERKIVPYCMFVGFISIKIIVQNINVSMVSLTIYPNAEYRK